MTFGKRTRAVVALMSLAMAFAMVTVDVADARRGGSFGSRGFRTFQPPAATRTAPRETAPVQRSMTPRSEQGQPSAAARQPGAATQQRPGFLRNGFGGIIGGLVLGGLLGMLMGYGFGGMAGFLGLVLQLGLLFLGISLLMRFFGRQRQAHPVGAGVSPGVGQSNAYDAPSGRIEPEQFGRGHPGGAQFGAASVPSSGTDEVGITQSDLDSFERLLGEIQGAFGREDYAALRERCTPEIVSYLSEELSQNAVNGLRNEVSDVKLLQGDLAEAWREGSTEYATVAMRYESRDVMREREGGRVASGDPDEFTETTEIWTFVREPGSEWKLSAIQEA